MAEMIDLQTMDVLIVDDMENMCKAIRGMMRILKFGKTFRFAANGPEAWNLIRKEYVDLAIVDWNMPEMTGVELLNLIRNDRALRDMPVLMVTAESNKEIVAEAAESDIDAYLLKPLTIKSLGDKISNIVEKVNNPPPMVFHLKNARELEENGNMDAAVEAVYKAMKAEPESSKPTRELGYLYFKKHDFENAEKWLLKAADMNDLDVFAFHHLGELYLKRNDIDKASEYFDKAVTISPRHVSRSIEFAKVMVQKGMKKKAQKVFEKAIDLSGDTLLTQEAVAEFCLKNGMYDYALKLMGSILSNVPTRSDIMFKMGIVNEKLGKHREALSYLIEAGKKEKSNIEIKMHIAKNYMAIDQMLRAEQSLKAVLEIDPENNEAKELLKHNL